MRVLQVTSFISVPLAGLIVVLAPEFTRTLLGVKWIEAVPAMRALAVGGALRSIIATTGPVFMGTGKPRMMTKYQAIQLCILAALAFPFIRHWGIVGIAFAVTLAAAIPFVLFLKGVAGILECALREPMRLLAFPTSATAAACVSVVLIKAGGVVAGTSLPQFLLLAVIYGLVYLALTHLIGRHWGYSVTPLVREILRSIRRR
jgi:O-antigen/teichoic acid export membrane protein